MWVTYSEYTFHINTTKPAEPVELRDEEGRAVTGRRYRLAPIPHAVAKPMPAKGKVVPPPPPPPSPLCLFSGA